MTTKAITDDTGTALGVTGDTMRTYIAKHTAESTTEEERLGIARTSAAIIHALAMIGAPVEHVSVAIALRVAADLLDVMRPDIATAKAFSTLTESSLKH